MFLSLPRAREIHDSPAKRGDGIEIYRCKITVKPVWARIVKRVKKS